MIDLALAGRDAGEVDAGQARHVGSLARAAPVAHRRTQALRVGECAASVSDVNLTPFLPGYMHDLLTRGRLNSTLVWDPSCPEGPCRQ